MTRIYLDYNSTTPLLPDVLAAMQDYVRTHLGNPASAHRRGAAARQVLEEARVTVARCLGAHTDEVIFTSGATEANNLALFGLAGSKMYDIYVSEIEHPSVLEPCRVLAARGCTMIPLPVDSHGHVTSIPIKESKQPALVTLQLANHETGVVQNIVPLRAQCTRAWFHTDATQAVGKMPVDFHQLGVTTLACSGHKFQGPPGIGVLLVSRYLRLQPRLYGGHQQAGMRPGTEPVMLAVGLAKALQIAVDEMETRRARCLHLRQLFLKRLQALVPGLVVQGEGMPHTVNLSFPGCTSETLFIRLDLAGIDCSTGSACSSGSQLPSPVLQAMGVPPELLKSSMRFSLSHVMKEEEIEEAAERIGREVNRLQGRP